MLFSLYRTTTLLLLFLPFVNGCSEEGKTDDARNDLDGSPYDAAPDDAPSVCEAPTPGLHTLAFTFEGRERSALVVVPSVAVTNALPAVLNFHGNGFTSQNQRDFSQMDEAAQDFGFMAVYPQGIGNTWNAGVCCGQAQEEEVDDVAFAIALRQRLVSDYCADSTKIFATGLSNGGFLVHRLACEAADSFAAFSSVAGLIGVPLCEPTTPRALLQFHGTADQLVPFLGNPALVFPPVLATMDEWAARNGCDQESTVVFSEGAAECRRYRGCQASAQVELCTLFLGGHTWPSGQVPAEFGFTNTDIDTNARMWEFFLENAPL